MDAAIRQAIANGHYKPKRGPSKSTALTVNGKPRKVVRRPVLDPWPETRPSPHDLTIMQTDAARQEWAEKAPEVVALVEGLQAVAADCGLEAIPLYGTRTAGISLDGEFQGDVVISRGKVNLTVHFASSGSELGAVKARYRKARYVSDKQAIVFAVPKDAADDVCLVLRDLLDQGWLGNRGRVL